MHHGCPTADETTLLLSIAQAMENLKRKPAFFVWETDNSNKNTNPISGVGI